MWYLFAWICGAAFTLGASMDFINRELAKRDTQISVWTVTVCATLLFWPFMLGVCWGEK